MKHILLISLFLITACKDFDIDHTISCHASGTVRWSVHVQELPDADCDQNPDGCVSDASDFIKIIEDAGGTDIELIEITDEPPYEYVITAELGTLEQIIKLIAEDEPDMFIESTEDGYRIQLWEETLQTDPNRIAVVDKDFIPVKLIAVDGKVSLRNGELRRLVKVQTLGDLHGLRLVWPDQHESSSQTE